MTELKDIDIILAIIALAYTRAMPLLDSAVILAHKEKWPRYSISSVEALAKSWTEEMGFYRYHNLNKALNAYKAEIRKVNENNQPSKT